MRERIIPVCWLTVVALLTAGHPLVWAEETQNPQMSAAAAELGRIGKAAKGTVGVAALHLETGRGIARNANEFFPMASTVKVAVAAKILDLVDKGKMSLTSRIAVNRSELAPEGPLGIHWRPGLSLTPAGLLETMITKSDNTATDVLYRVAGGPGAVQAYLRALGLEEIRPEKAPIAKVGLGKRGGISSERYPPFGSNYSPCPSEFNEFNPAIVGPALRRCIGVDRLGIAVAHGLQSFCRYPLICQPDADCRSSLF